MLFPYIIINITIQFKFHLNQTILCFQTKFVKKKYFQYSTKQGKWTLSSNSANSNFVGPNFTIRSTSHSEHELYHHIQHIGIGLGTNFHYKQTSLIFCQKNCQKRVFSGQSNSSEYYHGILEIRQHTRITIIAKFNPNQFSMIEFA